MTILSNGHQWKLTEFVDNKKYSFDRDQILNLLTSKDIDDAFNSISKFLKSKTGVVPFSESTTLITEGFYKYTRNPMYVGMNSFLLGLLIILNNPLNFIFLIVFFFIVRNMFVIKEEVQMEETFGEEYLIYKDKVRRWL